MARGARPVGMPPAPGDDPSDSGDTAWVLTSSALVLLMLPALALFYGGMVSSRAVISTMMLSFVTAALIFCWWALFTYSLAFSEGGNSIIGDTAFAPYVSPDRVRPGWDVPETAFFSFQAQFAAITAAVVTGAVVQRMALWAFLVFISVWHVLVYTPLARWIFYPGGWLAQLGVLDFAGGLVVELNSGLSAFVLAFWIGKGAASAGGIQPHNLPSVLLGAGMLYVGWLAFNAGSAIASGYQSSRAFSNTVLAAASAMLAWGASEVTWGGRKAVDADEDDGGHSAGKKPGGWFTGRPTALGGATGVVVGLVAITPACGYVSQLSALGIGLVAAVFIYHAHDWVRLLGVDDTLECFSGHGLSGAFGILALGLLASTNEGSPSDGGFFGGGRLFGVQLLGIVVTVVVCIIGTTIAFWVTAGVGRLTGADIRVPEEQQHAVDAAWHAEEAYRYHALQIAHEVAALQEAVAASGGDTEEGRAALARGLSAAAMSIATLAHRRAVSRGPSREPSSAGLHLQGGGGSPGLGATAPHLPLPAGGAPPGSSRLLPARGVRGGHAQGSGLGELVELVQAEVDSAAGARAAQLLLHAGAEGAAPRSLGALPPSPRSRNPASPSLPSSASVEAPFMDGAAVRLLPLA